MTVVEMAKEQAGGLTSSASGTNLPLRFKESAPMCSILKETYLPPGCLTLHRHHTEKPAPHLFPRTVAPAPEAVLDELAQGTESGIHDGVRSPAACRETRRRQMSHHLRFSYITPNIYILNIFC